MEILLKGRFDQEIGGETGRTCVTTSHVVLTRLGHDHNFSSKFLASSD